MEMFKDLPALLFESPGSFAAWLDENHAEPAGIWLKIAKKNTGVISVTYIEALDVALCYGWIDGQVQKYDKKYYLQKFTPRRAKSIWSKKNTEKAEALIAAGKMKSSGMAAIELAKADGRWDAAYHSSANYKMPTDFQAALNASPKAKKFFESLNSANRYAIYFQTQTASTKNRQTKIEKLIKMLERGEKIHP